MAGGGVVFELLQELHSHHGFPRPVLHQGLDGGVLEDHHDVAVVLYTHDGALVGYIRDAGLVNGCGAWFIVGSLSFLTRPARRRGGSAAGRVQ